jgi:prepilin-type N-terminal cleavage/methylation domain-containing protein
MKDKMISLINNRLQKGYSIIEIMVTLVVVGAGLLAIVQLQSGLSKQVGDNKAKAEATAIAEARIEEMRNYTNQASTLAEFDIILVAGSNSTISGVNADFLREEIVTSIGDIKKVEVKVSWTDRNEEYNEVVVTSDIAYVATESYGQAAISYITTDSFSLPRGLATVGQGTVSDLSNNALETAESLNRRDGTREVVDGDNKYLLVGDKIVLTLANINCGGDPTKCDEGFTRIHGRVYIDKTSFINQGIEPLKSGAVDVIASNAAYCTRFYDPNNNDPLRYNKDGIIIGSRTISQITNVDSDTTGMTTPTDYEYFDYTCYVSRGWYGNIGVYFYYDPQNYCDNPESLACIDLIGGYQRATQSCLGDSSPEEPVADLDDATHEETYNTSSPFSNEAYRPEYALSTYRAYRGMIYTDITKPESIRSIGVRGDLELGFEPFDQGQNDFKPLHNFVISYINSNAVAKDCVEQPGNKVGPLRRPDSTAGTLFIGVPDDFVCLNPDKLDYSGLDYLADYCPMDPTTAP